MRNKYNISVFFEYALKSKWVISLSSAMLLSACGGGGGGSSDNSGSTPVVPNPPQSCADYQYLDNQTCKNKLTQQIPFPNIPTTRVGDEFTLNIKTSSAGLPLSYSSLSSNICSIDASAKVKALAQGECRLKIMQTGNATYLPATDLISNFTILAGSGNQGNDAIAADIAKCEAGQVSQQHKDAALKTVNEIRALHGLNAVSYDKNSETQVQQAALVAAANRSLSHEPAANSPCYSESALLGSRNSNLDMKFSSLPLSVDLQSALINMLTEEHSSSIGHRRWLLNPFLKQVSFGAVLDARGTGQYQYLTASAVKVIYEEDLKQASTTQTGIVAYPYGNYPAKYFTQGVPLSVSIFRDNQDYTKNKEVDFSQATVKVTDRQSTQLQNISNLSFDNLGMGLGNSVQFNLDQLSYNRVYDVQVLNVKINGIIHNYNYWFKIVE